MFHASFWPTEYAESCMPYMACHRSKEYKCACLACQGLLNVNGFVWNCLSVCPSSCYLSFCRSVQRQISPRRKKDEEKNAESARQEHIWTHVLGLDNIIYFPSTIQKVTCAIQWISRAPRQGVWFWLDTKSQRSYWQIHCHGTENSAIRMHGRNIKVWTFMRERKGGRERAR